MLRVFVAAIILVVSTGLAMAESRVALVFGAGRYETIRPLENAVNDARAIEEALDALGFEVFIETNRNLRRMRRALSDFAEDAASADVAFVFFAGHGVEINGQNMLLPTDASTASLDSLKASSLPLEELRETVAKVAKIGLIVLDACRDDPFGAISDPGGRGATALALPQTVKPGLGRMGRAENTLFAFSAAPGETASDGEGGNSPFTTALTKYLGTEGLEIRSVLTLVQQEVYDRSRGSQLPYVESGLPRLFFASQTADELPERERLLLAMADVSPQMRLDVERIAADAQMPLAPLYGALIGSDLASLNREERGNKLREAAAAFTKVRDELRSLRSGDERVTALRQQAEEQLSLGAFDAARARLTEAANIDATSRETLRANFIERTLSEAATHYLNGGAAAAELRHTLAIADYEKAAVLYSEVEEEDIPADDRHQQILTLEALGNVNITIGNIGKAASALNRRLRVSADRAVSDPANAGWQRDLSVSHNQVGNVQVAQGDLAAALSSYQASLAIAERLAASDPANVGWQRDLSVSQSKVGNVQVAQGDLAAALSSYQADLAIAERLAASDLANVGWQRDLSVSYEKVGDVQVAQGDLAGAMSSYQASLAIRERLATSDPANAGWQRDLSVSYERVGSVQVAQGDLAGAMSSYQASLAIRERLATSDPANAGWQRDLSVSYERVGSVQAAQGDLAVAMSSYQASLAIRERLATSDPANAGWQRDLSVSHNKVGNVQIEQSDLAGALTSYQTSLAIRERLATSDPANAGWQRDLSVSYEKVGDVQVAQGDLAGAMSSYQTSLAIAERLAASNPANAGWQHDLLVSYEKVGDVQMAQGDLAGAMSSYQTSLAIAERLAASDPANAGWQRDLITSYYKLAEADYNPKINYQNALDVAESMKARGILAPPDEFIPQLLQSRLDKLK